MQEFLHFQISELNGHRTFALPELDEHLIPRPTNRHPNLNQPSPQLSNDYSEQTNTKLNENVNQSLPSELNQNHRSSSSSDLPSHAILNDAKGNDTDSFPSSTSSLSTDPKVKLLQEPVIFDAASQTICDRYYHSMMADS
jgi:hypothetical protein